MKTVFLGGPAHDPQGVWSALDQLRGCLFVQGMFKWLEFFTFRWLRKCKKCGLRLNVCQGHDGRATITLEEIFNEEARKNKYGATGFPGAELATQHRTSVVVATGCHSLGDEPRLTNDGMSAEYVMDGIMSNQVKSLHGKKSEYPVLGANLSDQKVTLHPRRKQRTESSGNLRRNSRMHRLSCAKSAEGTHFHFNGRSGRAYDAISQHGRARHAALAAVRPGLITRQSGVSDRTSLDNNFGSINPSGRLLENGICTSVQEDDEALRRLQSWFNADPASLDGRSTSTLAFCGNNNK